ncbi:MAG TPA: hypothetical protein VIJ33_00980 [Solirubrobacteraceae bacterium]
MQRHARHSNDRSTTTVRWRTAACLATALIAAGALVAGCGSTSPGGGVASLESHTSTTSPTSSTAAGPSEGRESSPGSQAVAYAACMHSHGVPNFPEPQISQKGSEVNVRMAVPAGVGGTPKFKGADQACRKLLPSGGPGNQPVVSPAEQAQYLKAAACIRTHGMPNFPDPTFSAGGVHIAHQGLNESSPTFKAAVHDCESLIPGGVHGGGSGSAQQAAP